MREPWEEDDRPEPPLRAWVNPGPESTDFTLARVNHPDFRPTKRSEYFRMTIANHLMGDQGRAWRERRHERPEQIVLHGSITKPSEKLYGEMDPDDRLAHVSWAHDIGTMSGFEGDLFPYTEFNSHGVEAVTGSAAARERERFLRSLHHEDPEEVKKNVGFEVPEITEGLFYDKYPEDKHIRLHERLVSHFGHPLPRQFHFVAEDAEQERRNLGL